MWGVGFDKLKAELFKSEVAGGDIQDKMFSLQVNINVSISGERSEFEKDLGVIILWRWKKPHEGTA